MEVLLVLLAIGIVVIGPMGFFLALSARSRIEDNERKTRTLEARIASLERSALARAGAAPSSETETGPVAESAADATSSGTEQAGATDSEAASDTPGAEPLAEAAREAAGAQPEDQQPSRSAIAAQSASSEPTVAPAVAPSKPVHAPSLEERLGTRWTVWVGGLALALGGLLMARYAIEQGMFGPGARIILGLLLAIGLTGAGEYLRRQEIASGNAAGTDTFDWARPSIPAMLTAAGAIVAFGTIYAAHALYEFIGPALAFVALGATGLATMAAAALHGPMLAGAGLAGAMIAPVLVSSRAPSPWPVVLYIAVVAASAYGLSRLRRWLWLALATGVLAIVWTFLFLDGSSNVQFNQAALAHFLAQCSMAVAVFCWAPYLAHADAQKPDGLASIILLLAAVMCIPVFGATSRAADASVLWIGAGVLITALHLTTGARIAAAIIGLSTAGFVVLVLMTVWPQIAATGPGLHIPEIGTLPHAPRAPTAFALFALAGALAIAAAGTWRILNGKSLNMLLTSLYAAPALLTPLAALTIAWLRFTDASASTLYASMACVLALAFTMGAQMFRNSVRDGEPAAWNFSLGLYASAALAALALAMTMALEGGTLTVAFALAALGAAYVSVRFDIPLLRWCVAGFGLLVALRYLWDPRIGVMPGTTPLFNWLLFGYGVPALAFGYAARLMRLARGEDQPVQIAQALSILFSALLVFFQIRHFANNGDALARTSSLVESGLMAAAAFGFAIVLLRLDLQRHSSIFRIASYIFAIGSVLHAAFALGALHNPFFSGRAVEGGAVFNALMLAYLIPGGLALLAGRMADGLRPRWYVMMMRIAAVALVFTYCCLQLRRAFQGPRIGLLRGFGDGEWYAYSALMLVFGIALLAYGLWRRSIEVRLASALFIVAAVLKVFLFDLQGLEGILRALSFIGLGAVLIGIGLVYQKFVFARKADEIGDNGPPPASAPLPGAPPPQT